MKKLLMILLLISAAVGLQAQSKYFTKNGKIYFNATSPSSPEKIEGTNEKATSILDVSNGTMEFAVLMKGFTFEKALMQEHFNENYVESDKFPKAIFKGNVTNINTVDLAKDGVYPVKVKGTLTLHGESKEVEADGNLTVKSGNITAGTSTFNVILKDYKIEVPSLVKDKVSEKAEIKIDVNYNLFKSS
jgi:polyisoprenoid-binding protein YceI